MKNLLALISIAAALTACSKAPDAPAAAPTPAATPAAAAAPASSDLPRECSDYVNKVNACMSKQSGASADAIKASMEQTKATWASMGADKAALGNACKLASDGFAAQAAAMKC